MPDYESMTAAEIEDVKAEMKGEIRRIRGAMKVAENARRVKHMTELAEQALKNAGVTGVSIAPESVQLKGDGAEMGATNE